MKLTTTIAIALTASLSLVACIDDAPGDDFVEDTATSTAEVVVQGGEGEQYLVQLHGSELQIDGFRDALWQLSGADDGGAVSLSIDDEAPEVLPIAADDATMTAILDTAADHGLVFATSASEAPNATANTYGLPPKFGSSGGTTCHMCYCDGYSCWQLYQVYNGWCSYHDVNACYGGGTKPKKETPW